ncbi:kinase-like domain-containing protein [Hyaloscypha finlandica]|nr:kinase-like domain-containing protein [Hyaloscypha finlandica]
MTLSPLSHEDLCDSEIVQRCADPHRQLVGASKNVVRLSDDVVVKFGWNVAAEEASNQRRTFELLDRKIARVPQVYRYFSQSNRLGWPKSGYIVMEYIRGKVLGEDKTPSNEQVKRIAQILHYFSTLQGDRPGPLEGGISLGLLWEENGKRVLPDVESKLRIMSYPLVLCHLDLAPRNFVWLTDGSAALLDWSSAGFYPRCFEVCMLKIMECAHGNYELDLIAGMEKLTEDEDNQMQLLQRSFYSGIKYSFVNLSVIFEDLLRLTFVKPKIHETLE